MQAELETLPHSLTETTVAPAPSIRKLFLEGGISLGLSSAIQRIFAFLSTALAARIGGAAILGEYSLALSTAGMVGTFVGTGVGTIALRYAALFPRDSAAYRKVLRLIALIAMVTAISAGLILFLGSKPLARFALDNPKLALSLKFAAVAIFVMVLYEALNGVLVATQSFRSLLWLALVSGVITVIAVPYASQFGATPMVVCYSAALSIGLIAAFITARDGIKPIGDSRISRQQAPRARDIILFGNTQQFNTIVISVASWWIILMISKQDPTLHQMGYYFVGSQLRILASQAPTLTSQLIFPTLSRVSDSPKEHDRVLTTVTFLCAALSFLPAGVLLIGLPWVLELYGMANSDALITCLILIATAVIQLTYVPASNALMIFSLRASLLLSTVWSIALVAFGYVLITAYGAIGGALAWMLSQLVSQTVLVYLMKRAARLPRGIFATLCLADITTLALTALTYLRVIRPNLAVTISALQILVFGASLLAFLKMAQAREYVPRSARELLFVCRSAPSTLFASILSPRRVAG